MGKTDQVLLLRTIPSIDTGTMSIEDINYQLNSLFTTAENLLQSVCGHKNYIEIKKFALHHPFLLTAIVAISIFSALPLLFFVGFTAVTLFISLICFLCIEGSLIAFGGIIFIGIVSFITVVVSAMISALAVSYFVLLKIRGTLCRKVSCAVAPPAVENNGQENQNAEPK
ncbi:hypothetical protein JTE90_028060 [Oedothorax gibbosus]|uniref:Promethin n=1 Tax=Oedothorax gibbosus TaxID=931172 RepID=A0AAV6V9H8_9ARAC|nr:hypothetical protein JTE90_028060 [Oedothorax gibbosus]